MLRKEEETAEKSGRGEYRNAGLNILLFFRDSEANTAYKHVEKYTVIEILYHKLGMHVGSYFMIFIYFKEKR